ncbi:uncharacterized protein LOC127810334 [Diospyros lotus]|uniref:uncharacterized protein LOC127810334 n=1 Tax=Diospyros lotus TaxID=55363 RepID=UPI00224CF449|nr:uncharacterized protein LOC127810334 [Diospyros lotus]
MGDSSSRSQQSTQPNLYGILGITKSSSLLDISKAYKALVMKWHPDKNPSSKSSEAAAKFREITEAYRTLSAKEEESEFKALDEPAMEETASRHRSADEGFFTRLSRTASRRSKTPVPHRADFSRNPSRRSTTPTPADMYESSLSRTASVSTDMPATTPTTPKTPTTPTGMATGAAGLSKATSRRNNTPIIFSQSTARRKPPPVEKTLECSLEELCHGCVKKIKITRDVISDTGLIVQEEEILKIKIKPGWKKGTKITFEGKGDQRPGTLPADITFLIDEKRHPIFKRLGDDLELVVEIPLIQALTGCNITVPLLGGEKMTLFIDDIIHPGFEKIIPGQGMPKAKERERRGNLRLSFLVGFPTHLTDEQRADILSILNDSSSPCGE